MEVLTAFTVLFLVTLFIISRTFIVVHANENVVKERLGKFAGVLTPGFHFMIPILDRAAYRHEMREQCLDVPPQSCITRDNIQMEVDGIVYLKVFDAGRASYGIGDYQQAAVNLAQTTMRSEVGKLSLDETFSEREKVNDRIVAEIDKASAAWGIKMIRYELRSVDPSRRVIDTMEKQMEAERQKRAAITVSEGQRAAQIAISEGQREEAVNLSEGEKQKRINEAEGRAAEIRLLATAQAESVRLVAEAIRKPGGDLAVKTQLVEQYLVELGKILEAAKVTVVPPQVAGIRTMLEGLGALAHHVGPPPPPPPPPPRRA
ncbi:MAG: paraslipin [Deltaproteobacteria bacterium]|nr:paraslipin [Deltaproteobacteria bacterium]